MNKQVTKIHAHIGNAKNVGKSGVFPLYMLYDAADNDSVYYHYEDETLEGIMKFYNKYPYEVHYFDEKLNETKVEVITGELIFKDVKVGQRFDFKGECMKKRCTKVGFNGDYGFVLQNKFYEGKYIENSLVEKVSK